MKLCVDCQHFSDSWSGSQFGKCKVNPSPVDGSALLYAENRRKIYGGCGPEGNDFVQKKTFWMKITGK